MPRPLVSVLAAAAAALAVSGCAGAQKLNVLPPAPARSGATTTANPSKAPASPQVLRLGRCELRFAGVGTGMGTGTEGTVSYFLVMNFVNVGHACTVGPRAHLRMTATTSTHGLVRARLSSPLFPIGHREHVTMVFGTWWGVRHKCSPGVFSSVLFHSRRGSQTVSFPRHPYFVCTPAGTSFYLQRFPA